ncbi:MAG: hypothetical protein ACREBW_06445 [Candidatus Micrarchaeaceae archaeon]
MQERESADADREWDIDDQLDEIEQEIGIDAFTEILEQEGYGY